MRAAGGSGAQPANARLRPESPYGRMRVKSPASHMSKWRSALDTGRRKRREYIPASASHPAVAQREAHPVETREVQVRALAVGRPRSPIR